MSSKGLERGADGVRRGTARTQKVPSAMSGTVEGDRTGVVVPPAQCTVSWEQSLKQVLKKGKTPVQPTVPHRQRGAFVRQVPAATRDGCSGTYDCAVPCVVVHGREDQLNHP